MSSKDFKILLALFRNLVYNVENAKVQQSYIAEWRIFYETLNQSTGFIPYGIK